MSEFGRRHHDMGGQDAGLGEAHEHDYAFWEKKIDAVRRLLADEKRQMFTVDEMRRGIEELGAKAYDEMSYYERWAASTTNVLPPISSEDGKGSSTKSLENSLTRKN